LSKKITVFILTHGRAKNVITYKTLRNCGYTGDIYIIIDNEDKQQKLYKEIYGDDKVIVFDKKGISDTFDEGDNFGDRRTIVYARNACFEIAEKLGIKYFIQLDDDYTSFVYKFNENYEFKETRIKNLDSIFEYMLDFYKSINAKSIALAQNGDFIGGGNSTKAKLKMIRKCMNSFICSTDRKFKFIGRINEDVNTYTKFASTGYLFLTIMNISLIQKTTQQNKGGMSDVYNESGTYIKSFFSVMYHPSSVKVQDMGDTRMRLHHRVQWKNTIPMILDEKYRKIN